MWWRLRVALLAALLALPLPALAERLAIRTWTTADGLAHDHVNCVVPDSRGFLWVCTAQGLSRFDGRRFVNYGAAHGLRELYVNDFVETRAGERWVATNGAGVHRLDPVSARFEAHPVGEGTASNRVNALLEDQRGQLWAATDDGLFRRAGSGAFARVDLSAVASGRVQVRRMTHEPAGGLLVATARGLLRIEPDGRVTRPDGPAGTANVYAVLVDRDGRVWTGQEGGLRVYDADLRAVSRSVPRQDSFGTQIVRVTHQLADGRVLVGGYSEGGLHEWDGPRLRSYTVAHGLSDNVVNALAEDRSGNVWMGTETSGLMRLARNGFVTFHAADGLGHRRVVSVFETAAGELCVLTSMRYLNRLEGSRFAPIRPRLHVPPSIQALHSIIQARDGEWWAATSRGLARYAPARGLDELSRASPAAFYTQRDGLATDDVGRPFEDAQGDVWVTSPSGVLTRWDRATGSFQRYGEPEGLPAGNITSSFGEDADGRLWLGLREGGLARLQAGRFEFFGEPQGMPPGMVRSLFRDGRGRLWAATTGGGLVRVEQPEAAKPRFVRHTTAEGLTSDHIRSITDDAQGRLYLGTAVGVDRFDPADGSVVHFTTADGLAQNEIQAAFRDRSGALWFGTMDGVSRLAPQPPSASVASPAFVSAVTVGGMPRPLGAFGERAVPEFAIGPGAGGVRIDYFASDLSSYGRGRFRYRLEGADTDWSAPTTRDSVEYAALAPGRYRFLVSVHGSADAALGEPATVAFVVRPPVWRRAWFLALVAALTTLLAYRLHRFRIRRALELERVRTRIASDLHDDIGSSLSQIAILSEVAARGSAEPSMRETLGDIAAASRETVDSLGDIVWSINPTQDRLGDLVHRMRRFASDVFTARGIDFRFDASVPEDLVVGTDLRRQVLLVFKEGVHNVVRHAACRSAQASVALTDGRLEVVVSDQGQGFDPGADRDGHGLTSMQARARALRGSFDVSSTPGQGTTVRLSVPLEGTGRPAA
jgi:ligand-binding sensor domain-containing protein/signal transduction histidine kinase